MRFTGLGIGNLDLQAQGVCRMAVDDVLEFHKSNNPQPPPEESTHEPDAEPPESDVELQESDMEFHESDVEPHESDVEPAETDDECYDGLDQGKFD